MVDQTKLFLGIAGEIGSGTAFSVGMDNISAGIALGVGIGVALGVA